MATETERVRLSAEHGDLTQPLLAQREMMFLKEDYDIWFLQVMGGHLLRAFSQWKEDVVGMAEDEDKGWMRETINALDVDENNSKEWKALWKVLTLATSTFRPYSLLIPGRDWESNFVNRVDTLFEESSKAFQAQLWLKHETWDPKRLTAAYKGWLHCLIQPGAWVETEERVGVPFCLKLHEPTPGMPQQMLLGGVPFQLRFDRYFVPIPTITQRPYNVRFWDYAAPQYEVISDLKYKRNVFQLFTKTLKQEAPHYQKILDIGQGTGLLSEHLSADIELYGVDISSKMIQIASERLTKRGLPAYARIEQINGVSLPYESEQFDAAVVSFVEIWNSRFNFIKLMREGNRILKDQGVMLVNLHKPDEAILQEFPELMRIEAGFKEAFVRKDMVKNGVGDYNEVYLLVARK